MMERLGTIEGALLRLFTKEARVAAARFLEERFRVVTLAGPALRDVTWSPGQKVQIALGGWVQRTYTPMSWDASAGTTELLLFDHGEAPGATWARTLEVGDVCTLFGPRASLALADVPRPALVFGDETSIGLAHALRHTPGGTKDVDVVLEVDDRALVQKVLDALGLTGVTLVERRAGEAHLEDVASLVKRSLAGAALTGKATSIQRLNRALRARGMTSRQLRTRAYWAPGKTGLD